MLQDAEGNAVPLDAATQSKVQQRVSQAQHDTIKVALNERRRRMREDRLPNLPPKFVDQMAAKREAAERRDLQELEEAEALSGKYNIEVGDMPLETRTRRNRAITNRARDYMIRCRDWAWTTMRSAVLKFPKKRALAACRVAPIGVEHFDTGFIEILMYLDHGHVWALVVDDIAGIDGYLKKQPGRKLMCPSSQRIDTLGAPGSETAAQYPFYSAAMENPKATMVLHIPDIVVLSYIRPSYHPAQVIPSAFVEHNIMTRGDYERVYPTRESRLNANVELSEFIKRVTRDINLAKHQSEQEARERSAGATTKARPTAATVATGAGIAVGAPTVPTAPQASNVGFGAGMGAVPPPRVPVVKLGAGANL